MAFAGFSLFRDYKAFVEVWRSRLSEKVEVTAEKDTYLPSDVVNVSVKGKEGLEIEEGQVALACTNRYVYQYETRDYDGDRDYYTQDAVDEVLAGDERTLEGKTILSGSQSGHELAFEVPSAAAPSASGEITNVEWKVRVTLFVRGAPDVIEEIPLTVLASPESYASMAEGAPDLDLHGLCDMEFRLQSRSLRAGECVEGTLVLTPRQDFGARTLRIDLSLVEVVSRESGNFSKTVVAGEVLDESPRYQTWKVREYPFAMEVPEAAGPCLETEQTYAHWWLKVAMNRRMARDPEAYLVLDVYNGPETKAER